MDPAGIFWDIMSAKIPPAILSSKLTFDRSMGHLLHPVMSRDKRSIISVRKANLREVWVYENRPAKTKLSAPRAIGRANLAKVDATTEAQIRQHQRMDTLQAKAVGAASGLLKILVKAPQAALKALVCVCELNLPCTIQPCAK